MRKIFPLLFLSILIVGSCSKDKANSCEDAVCPAIFIIPPQVKFNIKDKNTGTDLFFSAAPQYQLSDLVVFKRKNNSDTSHIKVFIDSVAGQKHFVAAAYDLEQTLFVQIQNQKIDTVQLFTKPIITNCCLTGYAITDIRINGVTTCSYCDYSTVAEIKK